MRGGWGGFQWNVQFQSPRWRIAQRFLIKPPTPKKVRHLSDGDDDDCGNYNFDDDDYGWCGGVGLFDSDLYEIL